MGNWPIEHKVLVVKAYNQGQLTIDVERCFRRYFNIRRQGGTSASSNIRIFIMKFRLKQAYSIVKQCMDIL